MMFYVPIIFTFTLSSYLVTLVTASVSENNDNADILALEQELEHLKHAEGRLLHQMRTKLLARSLNSLQLEELEDDVLNSSSDNDGFAAILSRGRRTPADKMRLCGSKIGESVKKLCPDGCTTDQTVAKRALYGVVAKRGLATTCCEQRCSMEDIKSRCCPK